MKIQKKGKKKKNDLKIVIGVVGGSTIFVFLFYVAISIYFSSHFFKNTIINGHDISGKMLSDVEKYFQSQIEKYELVINERNGRTEIIKGKDISLTYKENETLDDILKKQNIYLWPISLFTERKEDIKMDCLYDQMKLEQKINSLDAITAEQIPPQSAYPEFDGNQFIVHMETDGTAVNKAALREKIMTAVMLLDSEIDMESEKCYIAPEYTVESEKIQEACSKMNQYCQASITYLMDEPIMIDRTLISTWLSIDDKMNVIIDENAVKKWLEEFGERYDTIGTTRTFITPTGKNTSVTGGTYGWSINEDDELLEILSAVKSGKVITKEPTYYIGGTAASHTMPDWGSTYAEVDLSEQRMWFISNGTVMLETDVVTGEPIPEKITPEGVYSLLDKKLNEVLVGDINPQTGEPEYMTQVNYWMRITWEGIGFHDAIWQAAFGGNLNQITGIGSHGCINMPLYQAAELYDMIEIETPIIIHY
nr:L,D-transpeptidase family protein [uncultured Schaedlerella sp.]